MTKNKCLPKLCKANEDQCGARSKMLSSNRVAVTKRLTEALKETKKLAEENTALQERNKELVINLLRLEEEIYNTSTAENGGFEAEK